MKDKETWFDNLQNFNLPKWEDLPEFEMYMEQMLSLISKYTNPLKILPTGGALITPAMVNNYVKLKLIPQPLKKKYNKKHFLYILIISLLKQVFEINYVIDGIKEYLKQYNEEEIVYKEFCHSLKRIIKFLIKEDKSYVDDQNSFESLLDFAIITLVAKKISEEKLMLMKKEQ